MINICSICKRDICPSDCPNYIPPKAIHHCSICGGGILSGEEYITNEDFEFIHYECIQGIRQLLEWLGYDIKTMEEFD